MFSYRTLLFGAIVTLSAVAPAVASDCPRPIFASNTAMSAVTQPLVAPTLGALSSIHP